MHKGISKDHAVIRMFLDAERDRLQQEMLKAEQKRKEEERQRQMEECRDRVADEIAAAVAAGGIIVCGGGTALLVLVPPPGVDEAYWGAACFGGTIAYVEDQQSHQCGYLNDSP